MRSSSATHKSSLKVTRRLGGVRVSDQVEMILRSRLLDGRPPGARLPTEGELCRELSVSRSTLRRSLDTLAKEGLIDRQRGRGTYVREEVELLSQKLTGQIDHLFSVRRNVLFKVLDRVTIPARPEVAKRLQLAANEAVVSVSRVMLVDEEPLAYISAFLPYDIGRLVLEEDLSRVPIIGVLNRAGVRVHEADETIGGSLADPRIAEMLGIRPGSAVLVIDRLYYTKRGRPVDYVHSIYRSDRYRYTTRLLRDQLQRPK